jgi:hypothetical protein
MYVIPRKPIWYINVKQYVVCVPKVAMPILSHGDVLVDQQPLCT